MIIAKLDIVGIAINEPKADAPLIIYRNRMLPFAILRKGMHAIPRRNTKVFDPRSQINILKLATCPLDDVHRNPFRPASSIQFLRTPVSKRLDHAAL